MTLNRDLAKILWDYNAIDHDVYAADFIFVMCSYNLDVADHAADLYHQKLAPFIVVSGGIAHTDDLLATGWDKPEALIFQKRLLDLDVPEHNILTEAKSQNCGENVLFTKQLLEDKKQKIDSGTIVQKPYMKRRAYATASQQWPNVDWSISAPQMTYDQYIKDNDEERLIHILVGDTSRMKPYAQRGFQTYQEVPKNVEKALQELINRGYTRHISK